MRVVVFVICLALFIGGMFLGVEGCRVDCEQYHMLRATGRTT